MHEAWLRSHNISISSSYDLVPYDPAAHDLLKPPSLFGAAAVYGCRPAWEDVLDLGCGSGSQLAAAGETMGGRLVGIDLSSVACDGARQRCGPLGPRAEILQADFLDLSPADLREFDLIYLLGTIYVVPDPVRDHLLDLVAGCLKPGGVAMIGYYSGLMPSAKAHLYRIARALVPEATPAAEAVEQLRAILAEIAEHAMEPCVSITTALQQVRSLTDVELFHEALNPAFAPALTLAIEARLARAGIQFLTFFEPNGCGRGSSSRQRAASSEMLDLAGGGYRRALFGRPIEGMNTCSLFASGATWGGALVRTSAPGDYGIPGAYHDKKSRLDVCVHDPGAQALLDEMIVQPGRLPDLASRARPRLEKAGFATASLDELALEGILGEMWDYRLIVPLA